MEKYHFFIGPLTVESKSDLRLNDVVVSFPYTLQCEYNNVFQIGNATAYLPPPDAKSFTPFDQLSEETVKEWAEQYTDPEELASLKERLLDECKKIAGELSGEAQTTITKPLPWLSVGE